MSRRLIILKQKILANFAILLMGILSSGTGYGDIEQSRLDAIAADLQARIDEGRLSGVVAMIASDDNIVMNRAFGFQNVEQQVPMDTDTIFRIFSMTKPVTGTALMMLYDEGRFELDDPLGQYIPELADMRVFVSQNPDGSFETEAANHAITIRELMSHTGGFLYIPPLSNGPIAEAYIGAGIMGLAEDPSDTADGSAGNTLAESIPRLKDIPLGYQPGTQWVYSISVDIQGYLIEVLSGQTFDQFLKERIFDPLNMNDTAFYVSAGNASRLARQYAPGENGQLRRTDTGAFLSKPEFLSGGGGLTSTAEDYMLFARMHLNNGTLDGVRILSPEAIAIMRSNQLPDAVPAISQIYPGNVFGVDFAIVNEPEKYDGASKGTHWWWGIAGTWFWIDPVEDIVFVGMIQNDDLFYSLQVQKAMRELIYGPLN